MDARAKSPTSSGVDGRTLEVIAAAEPGLPGFGQPEVGHAGDCAAALGLWTGEAR
jgi:hypothetical protein